ncbi:hypothetical protein ACN28E_06685 [Archangium lansingense]|uniref:hypothetical protein n=1 Tax=Archangium lansingense TaxID=2995310 RepID=UPI003B7AB706
MSESQAAGRSAFSLLFRSPLVFSLLCPLSFGATAGFLGALWDPNRVSLWHLITALQPAFWLASLLVVFNDFRSHRLDWPVRRSERTAVVLCTFLAWVMSSFPFMVQLITQRWALPAGMEAVLHMPHLRAKLLLLGMLSAVVTTLHTAGILSVHIQLLAYPREPTARGGEPAAAGLDEEVLRYQRLRTRLERFLVFSAVTIGTTTLSLGAFRDLLTELIPSEVFEPSRVLGYGVYYTGLLASVYLPTRKTLTDVGEALAARFVGPSPAAGTSWKDWSQEQGAVRTWLGLQSSTLQDFQQGLSVLAPLLASLSALALGGGG